MSKDNGVYILVSRGRKTRHGHKKEYRVIHAQAIMNIMFAPDLPVGSDEMMLNSEYVLRYFNGARVFTDRRVAEGYAQATYDAWTVVVGFVEYGIVWFDEYAHIPFPKQQCRQKLALATATN